MAAMAAEGWDALLVSGDAWKGDHLRYVADFPPLEGTALAIVTRGGETQLLFESPAEAERAAVEAVAANVAWTPDLSGEAARRLDRLGNLRVAVGARARLPYALAERVQERELPDGEAVLDRLLERKSAVELAAMRRAAALADSGYEVFRDAARIGRREFDLVADVEAFLRTQGCHDNFMILGSGGREVRGMHPPGERRIEHGDLVTTELTPAVEGYYAQICRTLVIGPPNAAQSRAFDMFNAALEAGISVARPGATAGDIARAENDVFRRHGFGEYVTSQYTRVRGHGLGLYADAKPALLEDVTTALVAGMTMVVHPNTYHPEVGYLVLGDTIVVTETGCEILNRIPRRLFSVAG